MQSISCGLGGFTPTYLGNEWPQISSQSRIPSHDSYSHNLTGQDSLLTHLGDRVLQIMLEIQTIIFGIYGSGVFGGGYRSQLHFLEKTLWSLNSVMKSPFPLLKGMVLEGHLTWGEIVGIPQELITMLGRIIICLGGIKFRRCKVCHSGIRGGVSCVPSLRCIITKRRIGCATVWTKNAFTSASDLRFIQSVGRLRSTSESGLSKAPRISLIVLP